MIIFVPKIIREMGYSTLKSLTEELFKSGKMDRSDFFKSYKPVFKVFHKKGELQKFFNYTVLLLFININVLII